MSFYLASRFGFVKTKGNVHQTPDIRKAWVYSSYGEADTDGRQLFGEEAYAILVKYTEGENFLDQMFAKAIKRHADISSEDSPAQDANESHFAKVRKAKALASNPSNEALLYKKLNPKFFQETSFPRKVWQDFKTDPLKSKENVLEWLTKNPELVLTVIKEEPSLSSKHQPSETEPKNPEESHKEENRRTFERFQKALSESGLLEAFKSLKHFDFDRFRKLHRQS